MKPESANTTAVKISEQQDGILLMTLDLPGKGANILNDQLFKELDEAITPLLDRDDIRGLIMYSAKPKIFVAGADLVKISETLDWPDENIIKFCDDGRAIMAKFCQTPFPTVAAIHGACVGGGLELAMWCDRRVASDDRRTVLGLPEAKLGLVPGWAGTIRVARLCALYNDQAMEHQLDLVTSGRLVNGQQAYEMGFVDDVAPQDQLLEKATELLVAEFASQDYIAARRAIEAPIAVKIDEKSLLEKYGKAIVDNPEIYPFAPAVALEHMMRAASLPMKEACDSESLAMAQVYGSPASHGLIHNFFMGDYNKKHPGFVDLTAETREIETVGIIGAGQMGLAIAEDNLKRRKSVWLHDIDEETASNGIAVLSEKFEAVKQAERFDDFKDCNLVIESVVENPAVKRSLLGELETRVADGTIIATNTSAIPISQLAGALTQPERFCGIHFCHPELMSLVEVVRGPKSSEETIATATQYVRSLGKMPVVVKDQAGFVVNRLLSALLDQAFRLWAGGCSINEIDEAVRDFGFRGGPFEIVDTIGVDTCFNAGKVMWAAGLKCVSDTLILPRMVKLGWLGRKTGRGFYDYGPDGSRSETPHTEVIEQLAPYQTRTGSSLEPEQIVNSILASMALAASDLLEEGIASDPRDVDLCVIHGFSFPAHQGGILFWADRFGIDKIVALLEKIAEEEPRLAPTHLQNRLDNDEPFYAPA